MTGTVGSCHFERTALFDGSVKADDEVVTYHLEASLLVPAVDILHGKVFAFDGGRTVYDDFGYRSHRRIRDLSLNTNRTINTNKTPVRKKRQMRHNLSKGVSGRVISLISVTVTS